MSRHKQLTSKLFDNSDSEEECGFSTNKGYAKHYDEFRKKEILSHLRDISDDDDSSDDASTDEELVNPDFDKEFLKSLAFLKDKDPKKYEHIPSFFENVPTVEDTIKEKQLKKSKKPLTVADYQRNRLIETQGRMATEDEIEKVPETLSYAKEQEKIKEDLKKALDAASDDEDEKLFQVRDKPKAEIEKEDEDYLKWLAGQKKEINIGEDAKALKPLKDFWTSNKLPKADQFLRDYIVNKRYMDEGNVATYEDVVGLSEDEEELEQQSEFEQKYNFRFEEPDNEFIKRFPRNVVDSVRVEDTSRKDKRKERKERKENEKEVKMKDLRELQNIRKREIEQKLILLKEVAGNEDFALKEDDLNSDFDPDEHDRRMSEMFSNDYYGIDEGDKKPEFPDIDEELKIENWDNFDKSKIADSTGDHLEQHCEDEDFIMDADYDPERVKRNKVQNELIEMSKGRKRRKKISKLAESIKKEKPKFDPSNEKTYEEYLDEYYKLDYEDIVGDQPCRFRYSECVPNDFGLTVEEILMASNKELNQWASLKKTMQNRPKNVEQNDVEKYNRRRNNVELKKKIFASIYGLNESDKDEQSNEDQILKDENPKQEPKDVNETAKTIKKKKKSKAQQLPKESQAKAETSTSKATLTTQTSTSSKPHKRKLDVEVSNSQNQREAKKIKINKNRNSKSPNVAAPNNEQSENRLKAFGINPKKFKNKLKYGGNQQQKKKQFNNKKKL